MKRVQWGVLVGSGAIVAMIAAAAQDSVPSMPPVKPGLYEFRKFSNMAMFIARNLSKMPAEEQQKLSDEFLARPGPVFQLCVPPDGAKLLGAVAGIMPSCTYANVATTEHGFSADASCASAPAIHITFASTTPEHREVTVSAQPMPNTAVPLIDKYDINWISSDCGNTPPGSLRMPDGTLVPLKKP